MIVWIPHAHIVSVRINRRLSSHVRVNIMRVYVASVRINTSMCVSEHCMYVVSVRVQMIGPTLRGEWALGARALLDGTII